METKNSKGNLLVVLVIVLLVSTLALSGFVVYDKFIKEDEVVENNGGNKEENNNATEEPKEEDKNESNNNTTVECEDKDAKAQEQINSIAKKHGLTKIERYYADLYYCYEFDDTKDWCKLSYEFPLIIADGKLINAGVIDTKYVDENEDFQAKTEYLDLDLLKTKAEKLLFFKSYKGGMIVTLYVIDSNGDLYRLKTDTVGIESTRLHAKPNELKFEKVDLGNHKIVDFYSKKGEDSYYLSTTEGKILKLNNIRIKLPKIEKELN